MKRILLIYIHLIYLFINVNLYAQTAWFEQYPEVIDYFSDVYFINENNGWIVGGISNFNEPSSTILHTTDGGNNWYQQIAPTEKSLNSVCFVNDSIGWAVGYKGVIIHTLNYGKDWMIQESITDNWLMSVHFVTKNVGYACGMNRTVLKTINGGNDWFNLNINSDRPGTFHSIYFIDHQIGWVVGDASKVFYTIDGGNTWHEQNIQLSTDLILYSVQFLNQSVGWIVGGGSLPYDNAIIKTTDGGTTWFLQDNSLNAELYACSFSSDSMGWAVGKYGNILGTRNGGITWSKQEVPDEIKSLPLNSVFFINQDIGWIVGKNGLILKTTSGGITSLKKSFKNRINSPHIEFFNNYPNPFNSTTTINFITSKNLKIVINIYDIRGRKIDTIFSEYVLEGLHSVIWDASGYQSGIYFCNFNYKADAGIAINLNHSQKLIYVK